MNVGLLSTEGFVATPLPVSLPLLLGALLVGMLAIIYGVVAALRPWWRRRWHIPPALPWEQGSPSSDAARDAPSADQMYFDAAKRLLDFQTGTNDVLDTKSASILQVGSTVLPLTFGLLSVSGKVPPRPSLVLLGAALIAYLVLLIFAWRASLIRAFEYRPDLATLWRYSQSYDGTVLRRWVAEEFAHSAAINRPLLVRKARYVGIANAALFFEGTLISLAAGATLL